MYFIKELEDLNCIPKVNKILLFLLYLLSGESAVEAVAISYFQTCSVSTQRVYNIYIFF